MPSSRGSSQPGDRTRVSFVSCIGRQVLYHQHHLESPCLLFRNSFITLCNKRASPVPQQQRIHLQCRRLGFEPWVCKIPWRRAQQPTSVRATVQRVGKSQTQLKGLSMHAHNQESCGTSLAIQWLGLSTFTAVAPGSIPSQGTKILQARPAQPTPQ